MVPFDLQEISRQYFARVHRAALALVGNPWDADDLAQETFCVLAQQGAQNGTRFEGRSSIYTYLYGVLLNLERRQRRRTGVARRKLHVLWGNELDQPREQPAAETPIEVAEWKKSLWAYVAQLPDGQRQALVLRYSEGLPYDQIAEILGCPLGTVKSRIFHGLAALKRLLEEEGSTWKQLPAHPNEDIPHAI